MAISVGDTIPDVKLSYILDDSIGEGSTQGLLGEGKVVLFAVPGAFTPTCSDYHLPGFVLRAEELAAKGVDTVACISVNDAFVMSAWGKSQNVGSSVVLLADGNGEFAEAIGLDLNGFDWGMGKRSQRYAMILQDGVVQSINVEPDGGLSVSSADAVLALL
jgi:peroxiredoxin